MLPLPTVKELLNLYGIRAAKQLSQNFLLNPTILDRLVRRVGVPLKNRRVVEIGPGPGGLTRALLKAEPARVIAIEKDTRFRPALEMLQEKEGKNRFELVFADVMQISNEQWVEIVGSGANSPPGGASSGVSLVGNLPFGLSTPLLINCLRWMFERSGPFAGSAGQGSESPTLTFMFQKEVGDRIVAPRGSADFGRLSVMTQLGCEASIVDFVARSAFVPEPKVDACFVHFGMRPTPFVDESGQPLLSFSSLEMITRCVFGRRRKKMNNAIFGILADEVAGHSVRAAAVSRGITPESLLLSWLSSCRIDHSLRPQELSPQTWCQLANLFHSTMESVEPYTKPMRRALQKKLQNQERDDSIEID